MDLNLRKWDDVLGVILHESVIVYGHGGEDFSSILSMHISWQPHKF